MNFDRFKTSKKRDNTLIGPEFFNTANFPSAEFLASEFSATDTGYTTIGQLTLKNIQLPIEFNFDVIVNDGVIVLEGTARLDRLNFGVGLGDWQDTTWVGQFVDVHVKVTSNP